MAKAETARVTVRLRIGESEIEITGSQKYVDKKIAEFIKQPPTQAAKVMSDDASHQAKTSQETKKLSVAQFFRKISPKSAVDQVLSAGYYLERYGGQEDFTASEVKVVIQNAKIRPPNNPNDAINSNIKKGLIMSAGNRENKIAFVLTSDGEEEIQTRLGQ